MNQQRVFLKRKTNTNRNLHDMRREEEREREEVPGKTEAPDSQAEPQENLISHQSEVRFPPVFPLPLRLFNESDMCSQFVCIKQTNTHTRTQTHTLAYTLALLFIFMLYDIYAFCQHFAYEAAAAAMGNAFN